MLSESAHLRDAEACQVCLHVGDRCLALAEGSDGAAHGCSQAPQRPLLHL